MLILPAIDLRGGQCVRLSQGDYARERIYDSDPIRVAKEFENQGAPWIHVVDLDGAKAGSPQNWEAIAGIAKAVSIPIEVGGGVRSIETISRLLQAGVARVVIGTTLVQNPMLAREMIDTFDDRIVAGIDARDGIVAVAGWVEQSGVDAGELACGMQSNGVKRIILTDIAQDGMLTGPNLQLLEHVSMRCRIPVIQSGGIGSLEDLKVLYDVPGYRPEGVIIGRAIYEGRFTVREAVEMAASLGA